MHTAILTVLATTLLATHVAARSVPANIQSFYNSVKSSGTCKNILKTGFYAQDDPPNSMFFFHFLVLPSSLVVASVACDVIIGRSNLEVTERCERENANAGIPRLLVLRHSTQ